MEPGTVDCQPSLRARRGAAAWVVVALLAAAACGHGRPRQAANPPVEAVEQVRGGRRASPNQRAADNLPRVTDDERTPFEGDRMGLGAQRVHDALEDQPPRRGRGRGPDAGP